MPAENGSPQQSSMPPTGGPARSNGSEAEVALGPLSSEPAASSERAEPTTPPAVQLSRAQQQALRRKLREKFH